MQQIRASFAPAAALGLGSLVLADDMGGMNMGSSTTQPTTQSSAIDLGNTICPVSGDKVGISKLTEVYEGKIYHICCDDCPAKFSQGANLSLDRF